MKHQWTLVCTQPRQRCTWFMWVQSAHFPYSAPIFEVIWQHQCQMMITQHLIILPHVGEKIGAMKWNWHSSYHSHQAIGVNWTCYHEALPCKPRPSRSHHWQKFSFVYLHSFLWCFQETQILGGLSHIFLFQRFRSLNALVMIYFYFP